MAPYWVDKAEADSGSDLEVTKVLKRNPHSVLKDTCRRYKMNPHLTINAKILDFLDFLFLDCEWRSTTAKGKINLQA